MGRLKEFCSCFRFFASLLSFHCSLLLPINIAAAGASWWYFASAATQMHFLCQFYCSSLIGGILLVLPRQIYFFTFASFCVCCPFSLPILQQGQVGGILLPLQISSRSLRPTRHERFNQTSKKPTAIYHYLPRSNENSVKHQRQDHQKGRSSNLRVKKACYKKRTRGKIGGHITSFFAPNLHPHTSQFPGGRERGKMVSGGGGSSVHYDQGE